MMSMQADFLEREGWVMTTRKKQGCMWIVRWSKPGTNWAGCNQSQAYRIARDDKKYRESVASDS
jgi:hypothetical protein